MISMIWLFLLFVLCLSSFWCSSVLVVWFVWFLLRLVWCVRFMIENGLNVLMVVIMCVLGSEMLSLCWYILLILWLECFVSVWR